MDFPVNDLRPPGSVELECAGCGWRSWHDPLSNVVSLKADGESFVCDDCRTNPIVGFSCTACNRASSKRHLEMAAEADHHAHHCTECIAAGVPYRSFAEVVWCWACADGAPTPLAKCPNIATHVVIKSRDCSCAACWQTTYHACDAHVASLAEFFHAVEVKKLPPVPS